MRIGNGIQLTPEEKRFLEEFDRLTWVSQKNNTVAVEASSHCQCSFLKSQGKREARRQDNTLDSERESESNYCINH